MTFIKSKKNPTLKSRFNIVARRLKNEVENYCSSTTLHGFHYVTAKSSSPLKVVIWLIICFLSVAFCLYLINLQLETYRTKRVTTSIATTAYPIYDVPFPAVTICSNNLVYKNHTQTILDILEDKIPLAHITDFLFNLSTLIINDNLYGNVKWKSYGEITQLLQEAGYNTEILMKTVAQSCESLMISCKWNNREQDCKELFRVIKTTYGFCCSFNYKNEVVDVNNEESNVYVNGIGPNFGLEVVLNVEEDQYVSSMKPNFGLEVAVHAPYQYPDMSLSSVAIFPEYKVSYSMNPLVFQSDEDIRVIDTNHRGCLFFDERKSRLSSRYSFQSCISECKATAVMNVCKCIPYYYPIKSSLPFCTMLDSMCLKFSSGLFSDFEDANHTTSEPINVTNSMMKCKCLPQCNEVSYPFHVESQFGTKQVIGFDNDEDKQTTINVFFSVVGCTQFKRSITITWDSLLASMGGIFGLCLGGSIISLLELVYYIFHICTVRPGKKLQKKKQVGEFEAKIYISELYPYNGRGRKY